MLGPAARAGQRATTPPAMNFGKRFVKLSAEWTTWWMMTEGTSTDAIDWKVSAWTPVLSTSIGGEPFACAQLSAVTRHCSQLRRRPGDPLLRLLLAGVVQDVHADIGPCDSCS